MSWILTKGDKHYDVAKAAGLDPDLSLPRACADFYWLERAAATGTPEADKMLHDVETYLAKQFAAYLDMACGGELRLLPVQHDGEEEGYDCEGEFCGTGGEECFNCGGFFHFDCNLCHNLKCEVNKPKSFAATVDLFHCIEWNGTPDGNECNCHDQADDEASWRYDVRPELLEFFDALPYGEPMSRSTGWEAWLQFREQYGNEAIKWMAQALDNGHWNSSCGGPKWAAAARLLYDYLEGNISPRVMVNMAWSMEHNGGCIFNKVFMVEGDYESTDDVWVTIEKAPALMKVLQTQANNDYDKLEGWLSEPVAKFKNYVKYIGSTAIGRKYHREAERDKLEPFLYYREMAAIAPFGE